MVTHRLRPRSATLLCGHLRRTGVSVTAGLEADMAVDESRQIPPPKVGIIAAVPASLTFSAQCLPAELNKVGYLQGVTQPKAEPQVAPATFGFVEKAERWNSRACMVSDLRAIQTAVCSALLEVK